MHDVGQGQLRRYRQEHILMVLAPQTLYDMDPHFCSSLHDNFPDPFTHRTLQNLVAIFCDPHDVKSVVKSCVRSMKAIDDYSAEQFAGTGKSSLVT